jgi:hypothetical protein
MKVQIAITGQINGNFTLLSKLNNGNLKNGMFNSKIISFDTKKEAKKAIKEAYKSLCSDEPGMKGNFGGIRKSQDNTSLYYDASKAEIVSND